MRCTECDSIVSDDDLFCGVCGAVVDVPTAAVPAGTAAPAGPGALSAPVPATRDSRANTAYILGIISIGLAVVACIPIVSFVSCLGPVLGIIAIALGAIAGRDIDARGGLEQDRKKARQGMILGIVGFVLYIVAIVAGIALGVGLGILSEL